LLIFSGPICQEGYWGEQCNKVCTIDKHCNGTSCSRNNGSCEKCAWGFWGASCNGHCLENSFKLYALLKSCEFFIDITRFDIKTFDIKTIDMDRACPRTVGPCKACINNGQWGDFCENTCSGCVPCERWSGVCNGDCMSGLWGENCTFTCNPACAGMSCETITGDCYHGCQAGYWGSQCTNKCGDNCQTCAMLTGMCDSCQEGFGGQNCSVSEIVPQVPEQTQNNSEQAPNGEEQRHDIVIGFSVTLGVMVLITSTVTLLYCLKLR